MTEGWVAVSAYSLQPADTSQWLSWPNWPAKLTSHPSSAVQSSDVHSQWITPPPVKCTAECGTLVDLSQQLAAAVFLSSTLAAVVAVTTAASRDKSDGWKRSSYLPELRFDKKGIKNYTSHCNFLTLSSQVVSNGYTSMCSAPYWSNPSSVIFWHSGTLALRTERQRARMSKN